MDCVFLYETYEHGVSVLWRASAALLRWQRLAIRKLVLSTQRTAAVRALRAREERGTFLCVGRTAPSDVCPLLPPVDFARRMRQRSCELAVSDLQ